MKKSREKSKRRKTNNKRIEYLWLIILFAHYVVGIVVVVIYIQIHYFLHRCANSSFTLFTFVQWYHFFSSIFVLKQSLFSLFVFILIIILIWLYTFIHTIALYYLNMICIIFIIKLKQSTCSFVSFPRISFHWCQQFSHFHRWMEN